MFNNGDIDFLMPVEYAKNRTAIFNYPAYPMGEQIIGLYTLKTNGSLYYEDYDSFQGMRIGSVQDAYPDISLKNYAAQHHFEYQPVLFTNLQALHEALENGEVDAIVLSGLGHIPSQYKLIGLTEVAPFYIVARAGTPNDRLLQLDQALKKLRYEQPNFTGELHNRYLMNRLNETGLTLTRDEAAYLKEHPVITIMSFNDHYPIAYKDKKTGELTGIIRDLLDIISQKTGLQFHYEVNKEGTVLGTQLDTNPDVDLLAAVILSSRYRNDSTLHLSDSILSNAIGIVGKRSHPFHTDHDYTVAIPEASTGTISHVKQYHPNYTIITYPSMEDCYRAVLTDQVDGAMQNSNILAGLLQHPEYRDLTLWTTFYNEAQDNYCLASRNTADPRLLSIMNKAIRQLSDTDIQSVILNHTASNSYEPTLQDILYEHSDILTAAIILILVSIGGLVAWTLLKQRRMNTLQQYNRELEEASTVAYHAMEESKRANEAKTEFLSRMSHDIRTPLNGVIGMTALAQERNQDHLVGNYLDKIKISSHYLLSLVNDILTISKINAGKLELNPEPYPLPEFKEYVESVIRPIADAKGIHLTIDLSMQDPDIIVDKLKYNQIFFNLLSNAIKFTDSGGHVRMEARNTEHHDHTATFDIVVMDDGIGMSDAFQQRLFHPFEQEKPTGTDSNTGSGLGLAITYNLVTMMGGTITVKSQQHKGSEFTVHFSVKTADHATPAAQKPPLDTTFLKGKVILVAEDNDINREILVYMLENKDAQVITAKNGEDACQQFSQSPVQSIDAILMDIRMPVMDGLEATRHIRAMNRADAHTIPIIATTANAFSEDIHQCLEAGMDGHLSKPISPETLFATLHEAMMKDS